MNQMCRVKAASVAKRGVPYATLRCAPQRGSASMCARNTLMSPQGKARCPAASQTIQVHAFYGACARRQGRVSSGMPSNTDSCFMWGMCNKARPGAQRHAKQHRLMLCMAAHVRQVSGMASNTGRMLCVAHVRQGKARCPAACQATQAHALHGACATRQGQSTQRHAKQHKRQTHVLQPLKHNMVRALPKVMSHAPRNKAS